MERGLARLGGVCGLLFALLMVPAYVVGTPDAPTAASSAAEVVTYFGEGPGTFVLANGVSPLFSAFFFLWFLAALYGLLRRTEGEGSALPAAALAGGVLFITLSCAGYAAEILYPASLVRFLEFPGDPQLAFAALVLSSWLYHFCQVGTALMASATSVAALRGGSLPRWLAPVGLVVALLALLHFVVPLLAALIGVAWVVLISALMLAAGSSAPRSAPRRLAR